MGEAMVLMEMGIDFDGDEPGVELGEVSKCIAKVGTRWLYMC